MKTKVLSLSVIFLFLISDKTFPQYPITTFDSLKVLMSSPQYEYKNLCFNLYVAYSFISGNAPVVYEKWDSLTCNIAFRFLCFDSLSPEIMITNTPGKRNINPSFAQNMVVWQSDVNGNWDIYYSLYNSGVWSPPVRLTDSPLDDTEPVIYNNNTSPEQYNYYYFAYKQGPDIRFRAYKTFTSTWYPDTNVTLSISNICSKPFMRQGNTGGSHNLIFSFMVNDTINRIYEKKFYDNYSTTAITFDSGFAYYQPKSQQNPHMLNENIVYEYDTLGTVHTINVYRELYTNQLQGKNFNAAGSNWNFITDNYSWWYVTAFACLNKRNDSSSVKVTKNLSNYYPGTNVWKSFYLGNESVNSKIYVSPGIPVWNQNKYKIYALWEKQLNGKSAIFSTWMTDIIGSVLNPYSENLPVMFRVTDNYPNPFNSTTNFNILINKVTSIYFELFDAAGRKLKESVIYYKNPGSYIFSFNELSLSSGVYYFRFSSNGLYPYSVIRRAVLLK